jgi:hypothetical protein
VLEKLLDIEIMEQGTVIDEVDFICTMTGFRSRLLVQYIAKELFQSVALESS